MVKNVHDSKSKDQLDLSYLNFEKDRKIIILPTDWLFALEGKMTKNRTIKTTMTKRRTIKMIMMMIEYSSLLFFHNLCILFVILQYEKLNE